MHRRAIRIIAVLLVLAATAAGADTTEDDPAAAATDKDTTTGHVGIGIGVKTLDSGWEPLGDQTVFVVSLTIGKKTWPVHFAFDYVSGEAKETRVGGFPLLPPFCCFTTEVTAKSETTEWDLGVRRMWRQDKKFRPYAGGGIAFISGEIRVVAQSIDASNSTTGYWLNAGFRRPLQRRWDWGFDLRFSEGKINLGNGQVDAGGAQILLSFGGGW